VLAASLVGMVITLLIAALASPLIPLVFGESFRPSIGLVWWLAPAVFLRSISQVLNALLHGRRRPGLATYGQVSGLVVGGILMLPLIDTLGTRGAALASSIGELTVLVVAATILFAVRRRAARDEEMTRSSGHPSPAVSDYDQQNVDG
jgi:O-antigen/teichoic acid export membrane protein